MLKTSLVLAGDASGAEAALNSTSAALAKAERESKQLADAFGAVDAATARLARAQAAANAETARTKAAFAAGEITLEEYNRQLLETKTALGLVSAAHTRAASDLRNAQSAFDQVAGGMNRSVTSAGEARVGYMMLGQQAQDVAVMLQGGANIGTIIATQSGQVATAVAMMGGRMGGFASFMAGPWGTAIILGVSVLANLTQGLMANKDASDAAEKASEDFGKRLSDMAAFFDLSTGAILRQNEALIVNARLKRLDQIEEAKGRQRERQKKISSLVINSAQEEFENRGSYADPWFVSAGRDMSIVNAIRKAGGDQKAINNALFDLAKGKGAQASLARQILAERGQAFYDAGEIRRLGLEEESLRTGRLADELRKGSGTGRRRTASGSGRGKDRGAILAEFGDDTAAKIAGIRDQFSDLPDAIGRANQALRQLDDLTSDINGKKLLPQVKSELIGDIAATRRAIEDSLNKPFEEFMQKQRESAAIDRLLLQGREAEAEALRIVLQLQERQVPLSKQQLEAVLATVEAERQRGMLLRDQRALIQANLDAVYDMRGALEATFADALRGKFSFSNILSSLGNSWINLTAKRLVEDMFGSTLRALEDQATGADKVDAAGQQMATSLGKAGSAVDSFAAAVSAASGSVRGALGGGFSPGLGGANAGASQVANTVARAVSAVMGSRQSVAGAATVEADGSLTVTGGRQRTVRSRPDDLNLVVDMASQVFGQFGIKVPKAITDLTKNFLGRLETSLPELMKGAMIGQAGASLFLGQGGNNAGSLIGGAFGESLFKKAAPSLFKKLGDFAGPLGSLAGGLIGGLVGGLFKKTKSGGAAIGLDGSGKTAITSTAGNSAELKKQASGWGGTINSQLERIAEALGASLGAYSVAIGKRDSGWIKVSASGNAAATVAKKPTADIIYHGKDEGEALMAALANAISDGAITGVSAAVQKALRSSSDVDKAIREAMKVQEVELAIGGIGAQLDKAFKDFERQAAERLRIARDYGFDVVKMEERNAQDRLKLSEKLLAEQVGSLQSLIDEMTSGSLFEGSSVDQRRLLLDKITAAKAAADAGEEGAAEKLATLLEQLNRVSRDAFGTTGGFAQDRQTILDAARDTIAKANQRITDAQKASDPALAQTNAALDENNGQNAQMIALLGDMAARLAQLRQAGGFAGDTLSALARTS